MFSVLPTNLIDSVRCSARTILSEPSIRLERLFSIPQAPPLRAHSVCLNGKKTYRYVLRDLSLPGKVMERILGRKRVPDDSATLGKLQIVSGKVAFVDPTSSTAL